MLTSAISSGKRQRPELKDEEQTNEPSFGSSQNKNPQGGGSQEAVEIDLALSNFPIRKLKKVQKQFTSEIAKTNNLSSSSSSLSSSFVSSSTNNGADDASASFSSIDVSGTTSSLASSLSSSSFEASSTTSHSTSSISSSLFSTFQGSGLYSASQNNLSSNPITPSNLLLSPAHNNVSNLSFSALPIIKEIPHYFGKFYSSLTLISMQKVECPVMFMVITEGCHRGKLAFNLLEIMRQKLILPEYDKILRILFLDIKCHISILGSNIRNRPYYYFTETALDTFISLGNNKLRKDFLQISEFAKLLKVHLNKLRNDGILRPDFTLQEEVFEAFFNLYVPSALLPVSHLEYAMGVPYNSLSVILAEEVYELEFVAIIDGPHQGLLAFNLFEALEKHDIKSSFWAGQKTKSLNIKCQITVENSRQTYCYFTETALDKLIALSSNNVSKSPLSWQGRAMKISKLAEQLKVQLENLLKGTLTANFKLEPKIFYQLCPEIKYYNPSSSSSFISSPTNSSSLISTFDSLSDASNKLDFPVTHEISLSSKIQKIFNDFQWFQQIIDSSSSNAFSYDIIRNLAQSKFTDPAKKTFKELQQYKEDTAYQNLLPIIKLLIQDLDKTEVHFNKVCDKNADNADRTIFRVNMSKTMAAFNDHIQSALDLFPQLACTSRAFSSSSSGSSQSNSVFPSSSSSSSQSNNVFPSASSSSGLSHGDFPSSSLRSLLSSNSLLSASSSSGLSHGDFPSSSLRSLLSSNSLLSASSNNSQSNSVFPSSYSSSSQSNSLFSSSSSSSAQSNSVSPILPLSSLLSSNSFPTSPLRSLLSSNSFLNASSNNSQPNSVSPVLPLSSLLLSSLSTILPEEAVPVDSLWSNLFPRTASTNRSNVVPDSSSSKEDEFVASLFV